jgi:hypothetical protein
MGAVQSTIELMGNALMFLAHLPASGSCLIKTIILFTVRFIVLFPPVSVTIVVFILLPIYLLTLLIRWVIFATYMLLGFIMFLTDVFVSDVLRTKKPFGVYLRNLSVMLTACDNDPRSWYTTGQHHNRNSYNRLAIVGACMCPCSSSYAPSLGGTLCTRVGDDVPSFCPHAGITLAFEGTKPAGSLGIDDITTDPVSEARLGRYRDACAVSAPASAAQRRLVESVCQQTLPVANSGTDPFVAADVSAMCHEVFCSGNNRAPFCGDLIASAETVATDVGMFYIIPALVTAAVAVSFAGKIAAMRDITPKPTT